MFWSPACLGLALRNLWWTNITFWETPQNTVCKAASLTIPPMCLLARDTQDICVLVVLLLQGKMNSVTGGTLFCAVPWEHRNNMQHRVIIQEILIEEMNNLEKQWFKVKHSHFPECVKGWNIINQEYSGQNIFFTTWANSNLCVTASESSNVRFFAQTT